MEENKTPAAGILRIPCRGCSLPYDGAIDWVGYFLHVPRKCHIRYRAANIAQSLFVITHPAPCRQYRTVAIRYHTFGTVPPLPPHIKNSFLIPHPRSFSDFSGRWRA